MTEHLAQTYLSEDCKSLRIGILPLLVPVLCLQKAKTLAVVGTHGSKICLHSKHIWYNKLASMWEWSAMTSMNRSQHDLQHG